jgi:hypothetical protein
VAAARPTTGMLVVRGAAAAWPQDRSCRLGVTVWSAAGDRAPIGELQADLVGLVGEYAAIRVSASKPGSPGWRRAVTANSNPLLYADKPVMAIAARTDRPNCRVSTGTIPGNSVCGGSQRRGLRRCSAGRRGGDLRRRMEPAFTRGAPSCNWLRLS